MIMEKHKLIQLVLKDLEELNEIANELQQTEEHSRFALDIALSKSKLVYQELEFLQELNNKANIASPLQEEQITISSPVLPEPEIEEKAKEELEERNEFPEPTTTGTEMQEAEEETKDEEVAVLEIQETAQTPLPEKEIKELEDQLAPVDPASEEKTTEPIEEETPNTKKTVGENFVKGKSLNDLLIESKTLDQKLASSPIEKLETAIGLNDRFQYTRELFENKPELFQKTVQQIDQSSNLSEAVNYLNSNFKWKKTDTSIQFAQLVKRRFTN